MPYRLGIDIGGTFTDATLIDEVSGDVRVGKVPSTPADPSIGFMEAADRMLREAEVVLSVGPASRKELVPGKPRAYGLFYADEGWFLSFDEHGYLYDLVER